jgi:hypothetical protein
MDESPEHDTSIDRQRRVRRTAGLLVGGAFVATSALALPALATEEPTPAPASVVAGAAEVPTSLATSLAAFAAPATTAVAAPVPSPVEVFSALWNSWTPEDQFRFRLWVSTPDERDAIARWLVPPPPAPAPPAPKRTPRAAPAPRPPAAPAPAPDDDAHVAPGGYLACVRQRESGGRYGTNTHNGYYGAYQFMAGTWNSVAHHAGRHDLAGVLPSNASPADQDAMAAHLYGWQGRRPWAGNGC